MGFLNNESLQERGIDIKEFTVNSSTNNSGVEKYFLFRINRMVEGPLGLVKIKLYLSAVKSDETKKVQFV